MTLAEAVETIKDYCANKDLCCHCPFAKEGQFFIHLCGLMRQAPEKWKVPPETTITMEGEQ